MSAGAMDQKAEPEESFLYMTDAEFIVWLRKYWKEGSVGNDCAKRIEGLREEVLRQKVALMHAEGDTRDARDLKDISETKLDVAVRRLKVIAREPGSVGELAKQSLLDLGVQP